MSAGNVFTTNVEHMQYWHIFIEKLVVLSFADVDWWSCWKYFIQHLHFLSRLEDALSTFLCFAFNVFNSKNIQLVAFVNILKAHIK